jgi:hypothetical protein
MSTHPEFEDLSAFVDGEAPQWGAHVDACPACGADVARLRAVSAAVGRPVPPAAEEVKEQAVSRALDAFPSSPPAAAGAGGADRGQTDTVRVRRLQPGPSPTRSPAPVAAPPRRAQSRWLALGSVAAVLLAVLVGAAVLRTAGGGNDATQTLASGSADSAEKATAPAGYEARSSIADDGAGGAGATGADLGPVDDAAQLAAKAGAALGQVPPSGPVPAGAEPPVAALAPARDANLARTAVGTRPCEQQVRVLRPALREVVYFATGTTGGRPVYVLGFATGPDPAPVTLLAVAQQGCGIVLEAARP